MLVEVETRGFRNLEPCRVSLDPGSHLILGDNGAGKTSFIEAIYLLATTRSFRTSKIADCCRHGTSSFSVEGEIEGQSRTRLEVDWSEGNRHRRVNGNQGSLAEHLDVLPVVCWTTGDIEILIGPPTERRRFLDRGIMSLRPSTLSTYSRYRRVLEEKRHLLQRGGSEIATWNQLLAESAARVIELRSRYTLELQLVVDQVVKECGLGFPKIDLLYQCSPKSGEKGPEQIFVDLMDVAAREIRFQKPLFGPHRDDLKILWGGHGIRRVASAGERKALGLVLLAAQGQVLSTARRPPLFLLDDADTELDHRRLGGLWRFFGATQQLLATSNRPQIWEPLAIDSRWHFENGSPTRR